MKNERIPIAVAGLGRIGWYFHCAQIAQNRRFRLVATVDADPARRLEAEKTYHCPAYADFGDMLRGSGAECVVVATPTHLHKPHAVAALGRGMHVFLEKPMGLDAAEAESILLAAGRAGRLLTVYQPCRAIAWFQQACRLLRRGVVGEVYHVRSAKFRFARRNDWQSLGRYGGGMLNNYGAHCLDQTLFLTGYDVKDLFCTLRQVASLGDTEDVVKIIYRTRAGMVGEVDINQACVAEPYEFEAYGTRGVLRKEGENLIVKRLSGRLKAKSLDRALASAGREYPHDDVKTAERVFPIDNRLAVDIYENLAAAILSRGELLVKPQETLAVTRMMQRCRECAGSILKTPI